MKARTQTVIVEYRHGDWWTLFHDGTIQVFGAATDAAKAIARASRRGNRAITVTKIEWRDTPDGFVPPTTETR